MASKQFVLLRFLLRVRPWASQAQGRTRRRKRALALRKRRQAAPRQRPSPSVSGPRRRGVRRNNTTAGQTNVADLKLCHDPNPSCTLPGGGPPDPFQGEGGIFLFAEEGEQSSSKAASSLPDASARGALQRKSRRSTEQLVSHHRESSERPVVIRSRTSTQCQCLSSDDICLVSLNDSPRRSYWKIYRSDLPTTRPQQQTLYFSSTS